MAETTAAPVAKPDAKAAPVVDPKAAPVVDAATETIKVNGKEMKVTKAQLIAMAQKGAFADQTLKSVEVLKKSSENLLGQLKTPEGIVALLQNKSLGANPKEVIRKLIASDLIDEELAGDLERWVYDKRVRPSKMTPEEVEREAKLAKLEKLEKAEQERQDKDLTTKQNAQLQQIYQAVRAEVTKQIVADKTFPQTEGCIRQVIDKLRVMNKNKAPLTPQIVTKAIEIVKKDHLLFQQTILDGDKDQPDYGERLISRIGEERAIAISRALVARLQQKQKAAAKEEKQAEKGEGLKGLDRKNGKTPSGHTIMNW